MTEGVVTSREMRAIETNAEYFGVSKLQMMENAGRCVAEEIVSRYPPETTTVAIYCGLGGNGGDGFVVARHLACLGFKVRVLLAGKSSQIHSAEAQQNWRILPLLPEHITLDEVYDSTLIPDVTADVVVDALLGVGLRGPVRPPISTLVKKINELSAFCLSVDVPTGVNSDSGEVYGDVVQADLTVSLHRTKSGVVKATDYVGDIVIRDIGVPSEFERLGGPGDVSLVFQPRHPQAHKGDFGRLLIVGGGDVYSGAPALVAMAALRSGVDLVYVAAPQRTAYTIASMSPNLITLKLPGTRVNPRNIAMIKRYLATVTAVVAGPGLGMHQETQEAMRELIQLVETNKIPLLLDADGLKSFAEVKRKIKSPLVLTPHAGEYRVLTGKDPPDDFTQRVEAVRLTAQELDAVILLKGHIDLVSDGDRVKLNLTGNPGMTVGGTGDTLAGIVGSLLAQHADPFEAAVAGAFINGAAGDFVYSTQGPTMVPTDIIEWIPRVIKNPMTHQDVRKASYSLRFTDGDQQTVR